MFARFEKMLAWRYLRSSRQEGFVSVIAGFSFIGIMLGVGTLIVVMSVMNGFRHEFLNHIVGFNGHLWVFEPQGPMANYEKTQQTLEALPGIKHAIPTIERQAILTSRGQARGVSVHGMAKTDIERLELVATNVRVGNLNDYTGNGVLLGTRLAEKLNIRVGDPIQLTTPDGTPTAFGVMPRQRSFRVIGLFEVGMNQFDQGVLFMPLPTAQDFFKLDQSVTTIEVTAHHLDQVPEITQNLRHHISHLRVMDWQESNASFLAVVKVERNVMFLILALIILIAAFNIISGLIMLVKDKTKDIAILRTMGATKGAIMRAFFLTGATIGTVGTLLGVILGTLFALNIESIRRFIESLTGGNLFNDEFYFLSQLPVQLNIRDRKSVV